jgi:hypothetical protein
VADSIDLRIIQGTGQSAEANKRVPLPLIVEVSRDGAPAADIPVRFLVTEGGGRIGATESQLGTALETTSGPDGRASLAVWVLGPSGAQRVVARAGSPPLTSVTFEAQIGAPKRSLVPLTSTFQRRAIYQQALPPVVRLALGDTPLPREIVLFQVYKGNSQIGMSTDALGAQCVARTNGNGIAVLPIWQLGTAESQIVRAEVGGPEPLAISFRAQVYVPMQEGGGIVWSPDLAVTAVLERAEEGQPAPSDALVARIVGGDGQAAAPGGVVELPLVVEISRGGAPVGDVAVTFRVEEGGGTIGQAVDALGSECQVLSDPVGGLAVLDLWRLGAPGPQRVVASVADADGAPLRSVAFDGFAGQAPGAS